MITSLAFMFLLALLLGGIFNKIRLPSLFGYDYHWNDFRSICT